MRALLQTNSALIGVLRCPFYISILGELFFELPEMSSIGA
jgi:hypothetical protein